MWENILEEGPLVIDHSKFFIPLRYSVTISRISESNFCFEVEINDYQIRSVILWIGDVNLGHYTIAMRRDKGWFLYNDSQVYFIGNDPYFLYCLKCNSLGLPYTVVGERM